MAERNKEKKFLDKHKPLVKTIPRTEEEVLKEIEDVKAKYNRDASQVEAALTEFLEQLDPIVWNGKAIAWCRRPSMKEIKELVPSELMKYEDNPQDAPQELQDKYDKFIYQKMSEIIATPKYTAEQWIEKANPHLLRLFWEHIGKIAKEVQVQVEGF